MHKLITHVALPIGVLGLGLVASVAVFAVAPSADREEPAPRVETVEVITVSPADLPARVHTTGTAVPARQVALGPEVSGRVISTSDRLKPGGQVQAGDVLLQLDPRDYRLALQQEASRLEAARLELELERGRVEVAQREWALLGSDAAPDSASLALRGPQLRAAERNLEAAEAGVERARLALERTTLRAPFNAVVVSESAEVGQIMQPGAPVATLVGTDALWVEVSVPVDRLTMLDLPDASGEGGAEATVIQSLGDGQRIERPGQVVSLGGQLDPATRTATLLVEVPAPMAGHSGELPLLTGSFVDVDLQGRVLADVFEVPRRALVDGDAVWTVDANEQLARRAVEVGWSGPDTVILSSGLAPGERVVTSPLSLPVDGMPVSVRPASTADADAARRTP